MPSMLVRSINDINLTNLAQVTQLLAVLDFEEAQKLCLLV